MHHSKKIEQLQPHDHEWQLTAQMCKVSLVMFSFRYYHSLRNLPLHLKLKKWSVYDRVGTLSVFCFCRQSDKNHEFCRLNDKISTKIQSYTITLTVEVCDTDFNSPHHALHTLWFWVSSVASSLSGVWVYWEMVGIFTGVAIVAGRLLPNFPALVFLSLLLLQAMAEAVGDLDVALLLP